jgi:hypothetical protein
MNALIRRIGRLEDQSGIGGNGGSCILLVVCRAGWGLALEQDRCIEILGECGFLPPGPIGLLNMRAIPDRLNARETERFLRERGAETCGIRGTRDTDAEHQGRQRDVPS